MLRGDRPVRRAAGDRRGRTCAARSTARAGRRWWPTRTDGASRSSSSWREREPELDGHRGDVEQHGRGAAGAGRGAARRVPALRRSSATATPTDPEVVGCCYTDFAAEVADERATSSPRSGRASTTTGAAAAGADVRHARISLTVAHLTPALPSPPCRGRRSGGSRGRRSGR